MINIIYGTFATSFSLIILSAKDVSENTKQQSTVLKGFAICLMLFHHLFSSSSIFDDYTITGGGIGTSAVLAISIFSKVCVPIFVFVSTYGLTVQYHKRDLLRRDRIGKDALSRYFTLLVNLWCVYAIALIFSFILNKHTISSVYGEDGIATGVKYFIIDIFGLAKLFDYPSFNATWWYISFAIILFVLVPVMNYCYNSLSYLIIPISFLLQALIPADSGLQMYIMWYLPTVSIGGLFR